MYFFQEQFVHQAQQTVRGEGGRGGCVLREPLSTHQHRALPHIHLLLCCSGRLNTSVQLVVVRVMRRLTLIFRFSAECNSTLGLEDGSLKDPALSASSAEYAAAAKARLHRVRGWATNGEGQWLQLELANVTKVTAIATQGYSSRYFWTKFYRLESGLDGKIWQLYGKVRGIFRGALPLSSGFLTHQSQCALHQQYARATDGAPEVTCCCQGDVE